MPACDDRRLVVQEFDRARFPSGAPSLQEAWLGIYQVLWWYEHGFLHIREANDLKKRAWQARARTAEAYVTDALGVVPSALPALIDRMMGLPRWRGMQRNNPLGHGLRMLVCEILKRWGDPRFEYQEEATATNYFPGIQLPGRSDAPRIDVLATHRPGNAPKAVASCKWSIRHDRISDPTNECTQYKAAAINRQIMDLVYVVVTNELDVQRLGKVVNQPCVDVLVHVRLGLVEHLAGRLPRLLAEPRARGQLLDLSEFVQATFSWP